MTISDIAKTDSGKEFVSTGRHGKLNAFYMPDFQYTVLGKFIIYRLMENRDVKILITGKGKTTGTGKTTLGIHLARYVNWVRNELFDSETTWSSREYSFMNVWDYLQKYSEARPGDPFITDELEYMADRRRHQTKENLKFSQAWSVLRYKNAVTIGTAPGLMDLEKRIPEGADIWLNVIFKGKANSYYLTTHDFEWRPVFKRLRIGGYRESILWNPIEEDSDYQYLKEEKEDLGVPGIDDKPEDSIDESDMNSLERELKNSFAKKIILFLHEKDLLRRATQEEIAEMAEVSQPQVSKIKRQLEKEGEITI